MRDSQYQRITEAFQDLVDRPEEERSKLLEALLERDPNVHHEVLSLLAFDNPQSTEGDAFSDDNIGGPGTPFEALLTEQGDEQDQEFLPDHVGPYAVLRELGRGGMGTVYLCHQESPLRRNLAVKVIRRGMDTQEVVRRFDFERETIARMDHPGIARVLDAGSTSEGLPYIAMEYVDGVPLMEYCARMSLPLNRRLEMFVPILRALQHAHQRGVIHRDLKPSNVLVDAKQDEPAPKIIDFGLARALDTDPGEETTRLGQLLGTPAYMSPEQFASDSAALDVRTDVYSAGVMLFELLVGQLPFPADPNASLWQTLKQRADAAQPAPRPSSRYRDQDDDTLRRALELQSQPARLRRSLQGDLDWIVRTAMNPAPEQRYSNIDQFADDIQAHLDHRPVSAGPPHWRYRAARYVRRNRAALSGAAFVVLGLCGAMTVLMRSNRRALAAESNARELLTDVEIQNVVLNRMLQVADPRRLGPDARVTDMLEHGTDYVLEHYGDRPRVLAGLLNSIGGNYRELGLWKEAEHCLTLALQNQKRIPDSEPAKVAYHHNALALLYTRMSKFEGAEHHYRCALDQVAESTDPELRGTAAGWEYNLGSLLWKDDRIAAAEEILQRSLAGHLRFQPRNRVGIAVIQGRLGEIALSRGNVEEGLELLGKSLELAQEIRKPGHPQVCGIQMTLGRAMMRLDDRKTQGRDQLREALASARLGYGDRSPSLIIYLCALSNAERQCGDLVTADVLLQEAEVLLAPNEDSQNLVCAMVWRSRALWLLESQRPAEAVAPLEKVHAVYAKTYEADSDRLLEIEGLLDEAKR